MKRDICLSHLPEKYVYWPEHRCGTGWELFDYPNFPNIQRIDETASFDSDCDAAFHVLCAAAFDAGPEGRACRTALRKILRFGERSLRPVATMLGGPDNA